MHGVENMWKQSTSFYGKRTCEPGHDKKREAAATAKHKNICPDNRSLEKPEAISQLFDRGGGGAPDAEARVPMKRG